MRVRAQLAALALLTPGNSLIKIKGFRAVTARATFLCLCKETWRKESTPRLRARRVAPGSRSRRDFTRGHPAPAEDAAHPCAAPFGSCPPAPPLRRGPEGQGQQPKPKPRLLQQSGPITTRSGHSIPRVATPGGGRAVIVPPRRRHPRAPIALLPRTVRMSSSSHASDTSTTGRRPEEHTSELQ